MFKTQYKYDSFGRMRNIIYPDGEVVYYGYTTGGILKYVAGKKKSQQNIYLWDRQYDEQGRKVSQVYGNGVWAEYTYDPQRQWLNQLYTELPSGDALQNLQYNYDPVGNIMDIDQSALSPAGTKLGGPYDNHYIYDQQYRLVRSDGSGDFPYNMNAHYSPAGKMGNKVTMANTLKGDLLFGYDQMHKTHQPRTMFDPQVGTLEFFWDADGREIYAFDSDGNFTGLIIKQDGDHIGRIYHSEDNYVDFSFNDQSYADRICEPYSDKWYSLVSQNHPDFSPITHVSLVNNAQINNTLPLKDIKTLKILDLVGGAYGGLTGALVYASGGLTGALVYASGGIGSLSYALGESRGGKLDFVNSGLIRKDAYAIFLPIDGKNVSYDSFDFGNYIWGQSMQRLGIGLGLSIIGAHADCWIHNGQLDSKADQRAIKNGYMFKIKR